MILILQIAAESQIPRMVNFNILRFYIVSHTCAMRLKQAPQGTSTDAR